MVGRTLGHYRIESTLGEGGMGVVYKAFDTRLDRPVAIKVLPAEAVSTPERKRRFAQEAKAASALNHPGILHIYDIGTADGVDFIAMEYVDGTTLGALIGRKGMKVGEVLKHAVQIADALATAHAAGIVHRDIKPSNIMVNDKGLIKILDFGVAKLGEPDAGDAGRSTRTTAPRTEEGAIVGTVSYMSPEQAEGKTVDARSDIFSFGALLHEMLTGQRAFQGTSSLSTLAAILHHDPKPIPELVEGVPRELAQIVSRCLRKNPQRRMQLIADVKLALEDVSEAGDPPATIPATPSRPIAAFGGIALGLLVPAVGLTLWLLQGSPVPDPRFTPFATEASQEVRPVWSPDGKMIAYLADINGTTQVFTRSLDSSAPAQITKASANCEYVFWHPDGTRIYYTSAGNLWLLGMAGGEPRLVLDNVSAGTASPDGKTLVLVRGPEPRFNLWLVSAEDGQARQYQQKPFPETFRDSAEVRFAPDGSKIGVSLNPDSGGGGKEFWVVPYPSGAPKRVLTSLTPTAPVNGFDWMPDGRHLVFSAELTSVSGRHLYSADTGTNDIFPLTSGIDHEWFPSVSGDGRRIAFTTGGTDHDLIESPLDGGAIRTLLATSRDERFPEWSPNGNQYAYVSNANGVSEIWIRSRTDGWAKPIVTRVQDGLPPWFLLRTPRFSPDGSRIVYELLGPTHSIWISPLGGGRPVRPDNRSDQHAPSWSPDANQIAYMSQQDGKWALVRTPIGGGKPVVVLDNVSYSETTDWSRSSSGEWICYSSAEEGVQVVSPDGKDKKILSKSYSPGFGFSRDGSTVFMIRRGTTRWELAAVDVRSATERKVTALEIPFTANVVGFSLSPDGKSFTTAVGNPKNDIWLMEGFQQPIPWWRALRRNR